MDDTREQHLLIEIGLLEALVQEYADEHGPDLAEKILLGEASPPGDLLRQLREAERDLDRLRQYDMLSRMLDILEGAGDSRAEISEEVVEQVRGVIEEHVDKPVLSVDEAAAMMGRSPKTLRNKISEARRAGREFDWVLRAERKKGCAVDRKAFLRWLGKKPRRRGRPPARGL